jgi:2-polyprenyl-6-methoxyphenol hydroxylase-like FAD-dependent oxidoreductase
MLSTDFLIIGAGPAGASLACFLGRHSLTGIMLSAASGPARTPRAHMTHSAALECLRDLDPSVYEECTRLGNGSKYMAHYRWCETMAGEEYARNYVWGSGGDRQSEYENVSACRCTDLPQNLMEPVLLKWVSQVHSRVSCEV